MSTLGMVVLKNISIQTSNIGNKVAFSSIIRVLSNQIVNSINNKDFHIFFNSRNIFSKHESFYE